jgi:HAD superfamily hydrolase (TIGR01450 family)
MKKMKIDESLEGIKCVFLDLDGTIYLGGKLITGALEFLNRCDERGIKKYFLSNNSSKGVKEYMKKLADLGIGAQKEDILLSTHDLLAWLKANEINETYLVGTRGMARMLEEKGISTTSVNPQYVVLGYDTQITYEKLEVASVHLHSGVPLVASHPDMVCPGPNGGLPDVGAYLALFKTTTGVDPKHICGKPNPGMILHKVAELGINADECAMIGDRIYTDLAMAEAAGCHGILVLSGEARIEDLVLKDGSVHPFSLVVNSIADLL